MSAIDVVIISLFVALIVFDVLVAHGFGVTLRENRDKLFERLPNDGKSLLSQDVLIFENKVMCDILSEVKECIDEGLPLDANLRAEIDKVLEIYRG